MSEYEKIDCGKASTNERKRDSQKDGREIKGAILSEKSQISLGESLPDRARWRVQPVHESAVLGRGRGMRQHVAAAEAFARGRHLPG